jgi:hypothetical protein
MQRIDRRIELAFAAWEKGLFFLSRTFGLQALKALKEEDLNVKTSLLTTLCFHCGSIFFPSQSCTVKFVKRKKLFKLKKQDPSLFYHSEEVNSQESSPKLPKCTDWILYECHSCRKTIVFRGSSIESNEPAKVVNVPLSSNQKQVTSSVLKRKMALSDRLSRSKKIEPTEFSFQSFLSAST